jgi:hypothetical protein
MEDFLPDGHLRFPNAVDYDNKQKPVSEKDKQKVLSYMKDLDQHRRVFIVMGENIECYTDETYSWLTDCFDDLEKGKYQLRNEFVDHVLKKLEESK